jgi:nucleoside-diphosphate-sugar epimerase
MTRVDMARSITRRIFAMRVFVTGATGWVGSAVVKELIGAGHAVLGMARSDAGAEAVLKAGADVHRASLEDPDSVRAGAAGVDGVIHTAFSHDFSKFVQNGRDEQRAIAALSAELAGSGRPLVVTSGLAFLGAGRVATEDDTVQPGAHGVPRDPETPAMSAAANGVRASLVRLSPTVHGDGDTGFVHALVTIARQKGVSAYIGEGLNTWPAVHRFDAARLFRLALENGVAGTRYHAAAEEGIAFRDIATAIGRGLNLPVVSKAPDEVPEHFGWFARFAGIDCRASSAKTQATLGWAPTHPGLLEDLNRGHYYEVQDEQRLRSA